MPDLQEVFRVATEHKEPGVGALERQHRLQHRSRVRQKLAAYALAAALAAGGVFFAIAIDDRSEPNVPAEQNGSPPEPTIGRRVVEPAIVRLDGTIEPLEVDLPADASGLALSPDGTRIAFATRDISVGFCGACQGAGPRLAVVDVDGSDSRFLTLHVGPMMAFVSQPAWSPDGTQVAFVGNRGPHAEVFVVDARRTGEQNGAPSGDPIRLTNDEAEDSRPTWSADGTTIYYSSASETPFDEDLQSSTAEIWSVPATGGAATRLTRDDTSDLAPSASPDGDRIVFSHDVNLATIPADGGQLTLLEGGAGGWMPTWSPDGEKIAFLVHRGERAVVRDPIEGEGTLSLPLMSVVVLDLASGSVSDLNVEVATAFDGVTWLPTSDGVLVSRVVEPRT